MASRAAAAAALLGLATAAAGAPSGLGVSWTTDLAAPGRDLELRGLASRPGGGTLAVATAAGAGEPPALVVWQVGAGGTADAPRFVAEAAPGVPFDATGAPPSGVAVASDGTMLLVARARGVDRLLAVAADGVVRASREVGRLGHARDLDRLVPLPDGGALLLGHDGTDAHAERVGADGAARWDREEDRGRTDRYLDAVPLPDGGALLLGNSGDYDHLGRGPSNVFLTRVDAAGARGPSVSFPGRRGRLAAIGDGFAVVYDRATDATRDVAIRHLDARLEPRGETAVLAVRDDPLTGPGARAPFADFVLLPAADGGAVLAGSWRGRPFLARLDASGRPAGTVHAEGTSLALVPGLARDGDGFVAAYPVLARGPDGAQGTRLRLIGLRATPPLRRGPRRGG